MGAWEAARQGSTGHERGRLPPRHVASWEGGRRSSLGSGRAVGARRRGRQPRRILRGLSALSVRAWMQPLHAPLSLSTGDSRWRGRPRVIPAPPHPPSTSSRIIGSCPFLLACAVVDAQDCFRDWRGQRRDRDLVPDLSTERSCPPGGPAARRQGNPQRRARATLAICARSERDAKSGAHRFHRASHSMALAVSPLTTTQVLVPREFVERMVVSHGGAAAGSSEGRCGVCLSPSTEGCLFRRTPGRER